MLRVMRRDVDIERELEIGLEGPPGAVVLQLRERRRCGDPTQVRAVAGALDLPDGNAEMHDDMRSLQAERHPAGTPDESVGIP